MVKLAYTQDLGSCVARRAGSTPVTRTKKRKAARKCDFSFLYYSLFNIHHSLCIYGEDK